MDIGNYKTERYVKLVTMDPNGNKSVRKMSGVEEKNGTFTYLRRLAIVFKTTFCTSYTFLLLYFTFVLSSFK